MKLIKADSLQVDKIISIEKVKHLSNVELNDLCDALESTINDNYGFRIGFISSTQSLRDQLEAYFKGVLLVPERHLIIARLDDVIAGSIQLVEPPPSNKASAFAATIQDHFVAPWARGFGLAKELLNKAEQKARERGFIMMKLSVNVTMTSAIGLYEGSGYQKWGVLSKYEKIGNDIVAGNFYYKDL